jgi:hypothetical protein
VGSAGLLSGTFSLLAIWEILAALHKLDMIFWI